MGSCAGIDHGLQHNEIRLIASAIACDLEIICNRLMRRLQLLAAQHRFEEAEELRRRAALLERILTTNAEVRGLLDARSIVLRIEERLLLIRNAQLAGACDVTSEGIEPALVRLREQAEFQEVDRYVSSAVDREARVISSWLRKHWESVQIVEIERGWALPVGARPLKRFEPKEQRA
jgi:hypothetical protein